MSLQSSPLSICLFILAVGLALPRQVLAVQPTSPVVTGEGLEWQPSSTDLVLNGEADDHSRLSGALNGAVLGAAIGWLGTLLANPGAENGGPNQLKGALGGAVLGAIAGFILSGPSPDDSSELRRGPAIGAYAPPDGGLGLVLRL